MQDIPEATTAPIDVSTHTPLTSAQQQIMDLIGVAKAYGLANRAYNAYITGPGADYASAEYIELANEQDAANDAMLDAIEALLPPLPPAPEAPTRLPYTTSRRRSTDPIDPPSPPYRGEVTSHRRYRGPG